MTQHLRCNKIGIADMLIEGAEDYVKKASVDRYDALATVIVQERPGFNFTAGQLHQLQVDTHRAATWSSKCCCRSCAALKKN